MEMDKMMLPKAPRLLSVALLATAFVAACDDDDGDDMMAPEEPGTIVEIAAGSDDFDTLEAALAAAGLTATLDGSGPFTVFAPTDAAFDALPAGTLDDLLLPANQDQLIDILTYHVVGDDLAASDVVSATTLTMLNGETVSVTVNGSTVMINDAVITMTDIEASNGTIHVIDAVLLPPEPAPQPQTIAEIAAGSEDFETLTAALGAAELVETLDGPGPFTVFAPTDDAFAALPAGTVDDLLLPENKDQLIDILTYHVVGDDLAATDVVAAASLTMLNGVEAEITVDGSTVMIENAVITMTDIEASNGTIHVIDAVLLPAPTVYGVAAGSEDFETLTAAIDAAELAETLDGPGSFTVFAPTDAAFEALPAGTVDDLLLPENQAALIDILTYHVVGDELAAEDVVAAATLTMLNGDDVTITVDGENVMINDAMVTMTDVEARNGVVHVIDAVLLPPEE
jgi:transforming growth factor-beta-induced protein